MALGDKRFAKLMSNPAKTDLLILDNWGLPPFATEQRRGMQGSGEPQPSKPVMAVGATSMSNTNIKTTRKAVIDKLNTTDINLEKKEKRHARNAEIIYSHECDNKAEFKIRLKNFN